jgi:hypothetical protein
MAAAGQAQAAPVAMPAGGNPDIFVPQVHGPNDPPATAQDIAAAPQALTGQVQATAAGGPRNGYDRADLRQGGHDDAFVF